MLSIGHTNLLTRQSLDILLSHVRRLEIIQSRGFEFVTVAVQLISALTEGVHLELQNALYQEVAHVSF